MSQSVLIQAEVKTTANENHRPSNIVAYMRDMLRELQGMTPGEAGYMLPYLIAMAETEASETVERLRSKTS